MLRILYSLAPLGLTLLLSASVAAAQDTGALEAAATNKAVIGLMTTLPIAGRQGQAPWAFFSELERRFQVKQVPMDTESVDDDVKVLLVVHPKGINDTAQYAIDQFVMRGGKLIACLDPMCLSDLDRQNPMMPGVPSNLDRLLKTWGVAFETTKVVADLSFARKLVTRGNPAQMILTVLFITGAGIDKEDAVTSEIDEVLLPFPGAFTGTPVAGLKQSVLLRTTKNSQLVDPFLAQMAPSKIVDEFKPSGTSYTLSMRLEGKFRTAFPNGAPGASPADKKQKQLLQETKKDNVVLLIGDVDWLSDLFSVKAEEAARKRLIQPRNGNHALVLNLIDQFASFDSSLARTPLILPKDYQKGKPIPAVLWLHGFGSAPEDFINGGCQEYADQLQVALIGVSGTKARSPRSFAWADDLEKDAKRLRDALAEVSDRVTIKKGHLITFGFSQGAQVGLEAAVRYPEEYAGSIVVSPGGQPHLDDVMPSPLLAGRGFVLSCGAEEHPGNVHLTSRDAQWLRRANAHIIHQAYPGVSTHALPADFQKRFPEWVTFILKTRN